MSKAQQQPQPEKEKENHLQKLVGLLFLLASGVLSGAVIFTAKSQHKTVKEYLLTDDKYTALEKNTNRHMQSTNRNIELDNLKAKAEMAEIAVRLNRAVESKPAEGSTNTYDPNVNYGAMDESSSQNWGQANTPAEVVRQELYEKQRELASQEAYKEQYAAEVVENARRQGYKVILTPDYKVKSITPIQKDTSQSLFEDFGGTSAR